MGELQTGRHAFISYISPVHYNSLTHIAEDGDYIKTYSPEKYACLIRASQLYENSPTAQFTKDHLKLEFDALDGNKDGSLPPSPSLPRVVCDRAVAVCERRQGSFSGP